MRSMLTQPLVWGLMKERVYCADFRLEETSRDLQETKEKLSQEEFVSSELTSAQERLYDTAGEVQTHFTDADSTLML